MSGIPSTRQECVPPVGTSGLKPSASRAPAGHRIRIGMLSDVLTSGSKRRTAARAETTGSARASRRAFDSHVEVARAQRSGVRHGKEAL
jgi:hypothetical protein